MWIYSNLTKCLLVISKNVGTEENYDKSKHMRESLKQNVGKICNTGELYHFFANVDNFNTWEQKTNQNCTKKKIRAD